MSQAEHELHQQTDAVRDLLSAIAEAGESDDAGLVADAIEGETGLHAVGPAGRSSVGRANAKPVAPVPFKAIPSERTSENQASPVDTPKRGRPRIHPDRKAYKAEWERKRRAAKAKETK